MDAPAKMATPTVTLDSAVDPTLKTVVIAWTAPTVPDSHGSTVTSYEINVKNSAGVFVADTATCDPHSTGTGPQ
jgi:hypothetical protein